MNLPPTQWAERYGLYELDGVTPVDARSTGLMRALRGEEVPKGR